MSEYRPTEYIVDFGDYRSNQFVRLNMALIEQNSAKLGERIVRCRGCKHYYEAENYHPSGNYVRRCCKYFDTYNDEVEPDGFCAWGERRTNDQMETQD